MATTASEVAKNVLTGGAPPQQITYGATLTPSTQEQLLPTTTGQVAGQIAPTAAQAQVSTATGVPTPTPAAQVTTQLIVTGKQLLLR